MKKTRIKRRQIMSESERLRQENDKLQKQVETMLENIVQELNQQIKTMKGE